MKPFLLIITIILLVITVKFCDPLLIPNVTDISVNLDNPSETITRSNWSTLTVSRMKRAPKGTGGRAGGGRAGGGRAGVGGVGARGLAGRQGRVGGRNGSERRYYPKFCQLLAAFITAFPLQYFQCAYSR